MITDYRYDTESVFQIPLPVFKDFQFRGPEFVSKFTEIMFVCLMEKKHSGKLENCQICQTLRTMHCCFWGVKYIQAFGCTGYRDPKGTEVWGTLLSRRLPKDPTLESKPCNYQVEVLNWQVVEATDFS